MSLSHFDSHGGSQMVNVGGKYATDRLARASARVLMQPETLKLIQDRRLSKGDVFEVSRLAGIMAAKRTDSLIPLCHALPLESVSVTFEVESDRAVKIIAETTTHAKTGVEMEALVAASTAALCLYDMCKAVDRGMQIEQIQLEEKLGGKSGHFERTSASDAAE